MQKPVSYTHLPNQTLENNALQPLVMDDARARNFGGKDWFGIEWEYEPLTKAAMVKPGTRRLEDITDWRSLEFPDLSAIDWEKDYKERYEGKISEDRLTYFIIVNGFFERTADLTSFEDTFCYLLEEPEALTEFYDKLAEWHIELIKIAKEIYHADMILFHDDMETQINTFFSPQIYKELFLPQYQKITKAAHDMGMYVCLHSCGCIGSVSYTHLDVYKRQPFILLAASAVLLAGSTIGSTRAALTYYSENYSAEVEVPSIGVSLLENGSVVAKRDYNHKNDQWNTVQEPLFENTLNGEKLKPGKKYKEVLTVSNTGTIDNYVRVILYKSWMDPAGNKDTTLSPKLIDLNILEGNGWVIDEKASTTEKMCIRDRY